MNIPTCRSCPFWEEIDRGTFFGECRRKSPKTNLRSKKVWPKTDDEDFCGEHPEFAKYVKELLSDEAENDKSED